MFSIICVLLGARCLSVGEGGMAHWKKEQLCQKPALSLPSLPVSSCLLCLFLFCQTTNLCCSFLMSLPFLSSVMRRNPFGVDICCRKGSRSPLQELYNPTQVSPGHFLTSSALSPCVSSPFWEMGGRGAEKLQNSDFGDLKLLPLPDILSSWLLSWSPLLYKMVLKF